MLKRIVPLLLVLALALSLSSALAEDPTVYIGRQLLDFTVDTVDGEPFSLYQTLEDHDLVLINLWATWCGYCTLEFPHLQKAYEQYGDRVAVIALSVEPTDTAEVVRAYAEEQGLTFPMGSDSEMGLGSVFARSGVPTSVLVGPEGYIADVVVGAMPSAEAFGQFFDFYLDQLQ